MKFCIALTACILMSSLALPDTIYVPDDHEAIQEAIDASSNGDVVIVRPGTYVENIDYSGKAITVRSEIGPLATVIDGGNPQNPLYTSTAIFKSGEGNDSVLEGFTLTNGSGSLGHGGYLHGGGIFCEYSSPTIVGCVVTLNDTGSLGRGGGMYNYCCDSMIVKRCMFFDNDANYRGGGIATDQTTLNLSDCTVSHNTAGQLGGGIYSFISDLTISDCTLTANTGSSGGGVHVYSSTAGLTNCILWNDSPDEIVLYGNGLATVNFSCIEGGWQGQGNVDTDPLFADATGGDLHLTWNSPCRDAGDNGAATESTDFEGDPRIALGTVDMGADEYYYHLYHRGDVIPGSTIDVKVVGYPGAPVMLYLGSGLADPPHATQHGDFWLEWPPLWQGTIGSVPGNGVLQFPATVPTGWTSESRHPIQALVGQWGGSWSRLTNPDILVVN